MRALATGARIREFMRQVGLTGPRPLSVFLTGGASAVLSGWRETTVDIDLELDPEDDDVLREMVRLKDVLDVNVELASPAHFIPPPPGWRERSSFIMREGNISFFHYDFYAQALAKIERCHEKDIEDVRAMVRLGLVEPWELRRHFGAIKESLFRYPALDPPTFEARLERFLSELGPG